ncbi:hypothetical protein VD0004_g4318 [Verticillium dahliae]|nr:hypothetical protein VD0004_g4318 [Verticillium dahliae]PNH68976.1 hypothetical protein VD0001_g7332 [Verticillium dahliae]
MKFNIAAIILVAGLAAAAPAVQAETRGESLEKRGCGAGYLCTSGYCHYNSCSPGVAGCTLIPTKTRC